jgi:putative ABC transport system permease protein
MALGASSAGILKMVLRETVAILIAGCVVGTLVALSMTRLTRALLFETSPADPRILGMAAMLLILAGLLAGWLPARRAARVDPMIALRCE